MSDEVREHRFEDDGRIPSNPALHSLSTHRRSMNPSEIPCGARIC